MNILPCFNDIWIFPKSNVMLSPLDCSATCSLLSLWHPHTPSICLWLNIEDTSILVIYVIRPYKTKKSLGVTPMLVATSPSFDSPCHSPILGGDAWDALRLQGFLASAWEVFCQKYGLHRRVGGFCHPKLEAFFIMITGQSNEDVNGVFSQ